MALRAVGESPEPFLTRLRRQRRGDGRIGSLVNSTIWGVLALPRGERRAVRYLLGRQRPIRRLVVGPEWRAGLQRHRRGDPGAPLERCRGRPIRRGLAFIRNHTAPKRRCPARRRPGAGRPVDGVGRAGLPRRRRQASSSCLPLPRLASAVGRQLPLQPTLRGHAGGRDGAGPAGAQPEAVSTALTQSGSGRHRRPSATRSSTSVLR